MSGSHGFTQGLGQWVGRPEVYDGRGHFLGYGRDRREVRPTANGKVRIEVLFEGPFRLQGYYDVEDRGRHRLYHGPANYGLAEALAPNLVDAHGYWPDAGLSQRFFMMVLPGGEKQLSLALMSRGEELLYCVVGENDRVSGEGEASGLPEHEIPPVADELDEEALLHRPGCWRGTSSAHDRTGDFPYEEAIEQTDSGLRVRFAGGCHMPDPVEVELRTDSRLAWSGPGELAGSYSLTGGRALTGTFHLKSRGWRLWRREVATRDGAFKAFLHLWFLGQERIGAEWGVLELDPV